MSAYRSIFVLTIAFIAVSLSVATIGFVIWNHMGMPLYDDVYDQGAFHVALAEGWKSLLRYLVSQHNEHRVFTTRLLMIADTWLFQGKEYIQIAVSMALHCLIAVLIFRFMFLRKRPSISIVDGLLFFATLLLLSLNPNYVYTFLVPFQVQHTISAILCVLAAILVGTASEEQNGPVLTDVRFFVPLVLLAGIATLTLGNSPAIFLGAACCSIVFRWRLPTTALLMFLGIVHVTLVLATTKSVGTTTSNLAEIVQFLVFYLGSPLFRFTLWPGTVESFWTSPVLANVTGSAVLFIAVCYSVARFLKPQLGGRDGAAGLALMSFVVATGMAAAYSRAQFGILEAGNKKYSSFACLGLIAALMIVTSILKDRETHRSWIALRRLYVFVLLFLIPMSYVGYLRETEIWQKASERSWEAAIGVVMKINSRPIKESIASPLDEFERYVNQVEPSGLGPFSSIEYHWGQNLSPVLASMSQTECRGSFEMITAIPESEKQQYFEVTGYPATIGGWSWIPATRSPATTVVAIDSDNKVVGVAKTTRTSQAAEEWLGQKFHTRMGWHGFARAKNLTAIKLIALDDTKRLYCELDPLGSTK